MYLHMYCMYVCSAYLVFAPVNADGFDSLHQQVFMDVVHIGLALTEDDNLTRYFRKQHVCIYVCMYVCMCNSALPVALFSVDTLGDIPPVLKIGLGW